jgi:hypothetical protein
MNVLNGLAACAGNWRGTVLAAACTAADTSEATIRANLFYSPPGTEK